MKNLIFQFLPLLNNNFHEILLCVVPARDNNPIDFQTMTSTCEDVPIVIGEEEFRPEEAARYQVMPFDHQKKIAKYYWATPEHIQKAIDNGTAVR